MSNDQGAGSGRASRSAFARSREARRIELTHDRIAEDVAAFTEAGGKIEVLGNTPMLKTIGAAAEAERARDAKKAVREKAGDADATSPAGEAGAQS